MSTPNACQKSFLRIAIFVAGLVVASTTWAAPNARLLATSDLLALLTKSGTPSLSFATMTESNLASRVLETVASGEPVESSEPASQAGLIALAMELRNIRYRRGGRNPDSGFDCSGFVRYVFLHSIGLKLPATSAAQFVDGIKVARSDMRSGDLVFFRTSGKKRISHVGIYLDDGRFIHAPSSGKVVRIDSLDQKYWAKRFAGAKRPDGIALG
ncbi:MAG: C40 family peptidase [Dokdonella sp.]